MKTQEHMVVWLGGLGLFLATLDTGIINIALPTLQVVWHTTASMIAWTVAAYTVPLAGTVLFWGRLADRLGPTRIFVVGLVVFGSSSVLCGAAPSLGWLVGARAIQGVGSAMIQGTVAALVATRVPPSRRAITLGTLAMFQGLGPVVGPTVGGVLLTWVSWRWLFWINLPVTVPLVGILWSQSVHRAAAGERIPSLDWTGNLLVMATVTAGLLALAGNAGSPAMWGPLTGLAGFALVLWERRTSHPIIPRPLWPVKAFWASTLAIVAVGGATALGFMVPPYTLRRFDHLAPWNIGLVNMAAPLALVFFSRRASRLLGRFSPATMMLIGLGLMAGAFGILALTASTHAPWIMILWLAVYGIGAAAFFPSNLAALLAAADADSQGVLGALQRMGINVGTAVDATITGALLDLGVRSGHPLSLVGVRAAWTYGALTLVAAATGLWATRTGESDRYADGPSSR